MVGARMTNNRLLHGRNHQAMTYPVSFNGIYHRFRLESRQHNVGSASQYSQKQNSHTGDMKERSAYQIHGTKAKKGAKK